MTTTYFAAELTNSFEELVRLNLRNLSNEELSPFYYGPTIPPAKFDAGLAAAQELTTKVGLGPISESAYANQTTGSSQSFFKSFMNAAGIESEFSDDFVTADAAPTIPDLGSRSAFVTKKSASIGLSIADIRNRIRNQSDDSTADHLVEPQLPIISDSDPFTAVRLRNMREYVNRYLNITVS